MLNFFRRFRQRLIAEDHLSKYLIYALGEILLVVIGILIALQINNWNENQKNYKLEQQYLFALKEEFLINKEKLNQLDTLLTTQLKASNEFIQYCHPKLVKLDNARFSYLMDAGFRDTYNYYPSSGVLKDLVNSGKLSLINNAELRRMLADWDSNITQLQTFESESRAASYEVVDILSNKGNFRKQMSQAFKALGTGPSDFDTDNTTLMRLESFENAVVYFTAITWRLKHILYPQLSGKMDIVLGLIEEELN